MNEEMIQRCETCVWWDEDLYCLKITMPHEKPHCENGRCIYYAQTNKEANNEWIGKFG